MGGGSRDYRRGWQVWAFLTPALIGLGLFVLWPTLRALYWSFQDVHLLRPDDARWTGLRNYSHLLQDPRFRRAFANTALFALMVVPIQSAVALMLALWVNRPQRYWRWLRVPFFVPVVVSMPVLAVLWTMLYRPTEGGQMGLINMLVDVVGLSPVDWLHNPATALPAIAFMSIWQGVGFQMMIFLAGLQHISGEQLEAAKIDGAGPVARLFYVTIPGLKNSIIFAITMTTVLAFRLFVQPYLMTGGGPADRTLSVIQWIYEAATAQFSLGLACAAAILFLVVVAVLLIAQRALTREQRA